MTMTSLDLQHQAAVERKAMRDQKEIEKASTSRMTPENELDLLEEVTQTSDHVLSSNNSSLDEDFKQPDVRSKKHEFVELLVPKQVTETVALNAKHFEISDNACVSTLAGLTNESNGNLQDFLVSKSKARRAGILLLSQMLRE